MKARFEIETKDIHGGRAYRKNGVDFIIGYRAELAGERRWVLIDLRDGCVMKSETRASLARTLTEGKYEPEQIEIQGEGDE